MIIDDPRDDIDLTRIRAFAAKSGADGLLIGVDGGATKTTALICDQKGHVLGSGKSGPSNLIVNGVQGAVGAIDEAIVTLLHDVEAAETQIASVVIGLAGAEVEENRLQTANWLANRFPRASTEVVHDTALVLAAGTPGGWGLVVISGTGSVAYGRDKAGREAYAGKWGRIIGDDGSAYAIGIEMLKAIARACDGISPKTMVEGLVYDHLSISGIEVINRLIQVGQIVDTDIAGLAPLAEKAALAGDPVACKVIEKAGADLAEAALAVAARLGFHSRIPCALGGSTITKGDMLFSAFTSEALKRGLDLQPLVKVREPAIGALIMANRILG